MWYTIFVIFPRTLRGFSMCILYKGLRGRDFRKAEREKTKELEKQKRLAQAEALRKEKEDKKKKPGGDKPVTKTAPTMWYQQDPVRQFQHVSTRNPYSPNSSSTAMGVALAYQEEQKRKEEERQKNCGRKEETAGVPAQLAPAPPPPNVMRAIWSNRIGQNILSILSVKVRRGSTCMAMKLLHVWWIKGMPTGWFPSTFVYFCRRLRTSEVKPVQHVNLQLQKLMIK